VAFSMECLKITPDAWQADVLRAFIKNARVGMKACKGPGKTWVLSVLAWNFLATRKHPKIAATSITSDNLSDGLWTEMAKTMDRSSFLKETFEWQKTRIICRDHPETWFMSARTWPKSSSTSQQADTLAGLHAEYLLFILDEVGGIPDAVLAAAEAGLSTEGGEHKLLMAGNPTHVEGPLYRASTSESHLWHMTEITGDPDDPKRSPRVSKEWAQQQIDTHGKDNPWVLVNVFGKFPPSSLNSLLGPDDVSAAMNRSYSMDQIEGSQKRLGVDCARFGDDRTVIFPRQGLVAFQPQEMRNARSQEIAARVVSAKSRFHSEIDAVDGTGGFGAGVCDALIQAGHSPLEIHFSGKAIDPRYANKRAEMWFEMAAWVKRGGSLPKMPQLTRELTAPSYTFNAQGKFLLESKDQIKARLGFSPDLADALCLTFCLPEMPSSHHELFGVLPSLKKHQSDYDPFDERRN
jgi:phage terminase large subunit